jgi:hypothetical protein
MRFCGDALVRAAKHDPCLASACVRWLAGHDCTVKMNRFCDEDVEIVLWR